MLCDDVGKDQNAFVCKPPTRSNILEACKYVFERAEKADFVLFYFAGHGLEIESTPYLLTSDAKMDLVRETALSVPLLDELFNPSKARFNLKIFDACRSGYSDGRLAQVNMTREFERSLLKTASGWAAISACSTGEVAHEDPISGKACLPTISVRHSLNPRRSRRRSHWKGPSTASKLPWLRGVLKMRKQTPQFKSDISGVLDLSHISSASSPTEIKEEPPDPIREFYQRLDQHRDSTPSSTQHFSFTNEAEHDRIAEQFFAVSKETWQKFDYPAISVTIIDPKPLQHFAQTWAALHATLGQVQLNGELVGKQTGIAIKLNGADLSLPNIDLVTAAIRFKYFYWIWRTVTFESQIKAEWKPKEPVNSTFYALTPQSAGDMNRLKRITTDFMTSAFRIYEDWAKQLAAYLNTRMKPFHEAGNIFE
jgi:hypothetical protein